MVDQSLTNKTYFLTKPSLQPCVAGLVVNRLRVLDLAAEADPRVSVEGDIELDTKPLKPPSRYVTLVGERPLQRYSFYADENSIRRNSLNPGGV